VQEHRNESLSNKPVTDDTINADMANIIINSLLYSSELQHPMILHYAKRAHAYKACCGSIETSQMFNQYLANLEDNPNQGYSMDKLLRSWFVIMSFC
jgi:hypothetical protein